MKSILRAFAIAILSLLFLSCSPVSLVTDTPQPIIIEPIEWITSKPPANVSPTPVSTNTHIPSNTPQPTKTIAITDTFTPSPIPGMVVIPIETMDPSVPWLSHTFDENLNPVTMYFGFNVSKPPFNNVLIRQAFSAAINRQRIVEIADDFGWTNVNPATTFLHPMILGRDLYNEVGISFDPDGAREMLRESGNHDLINFPEVVLVINAQDQKSLEIYMAIAENARDMWKEFLGVDVKIRTVGIETEWGKYIQTNPLGYDLYRLAWATRKAEDMDPSKLLDIFHSSPDINEGLNFSHYKSEEFDRLFEVAQAEPNPKERQVLYIQLERILTEDDAVIIPLIHFTVR